MSEMIERVASAMFNELRRDNELNVYPYVTANEDLSRVTVDGDVDFVALARAVIEAMREPPETMRSFEALDGNLWDWDTHCGYCGGHKFAWQGMIDRALKSD